MNVKAISSKKKQSTPFLRGVSPLIIFQIVALLLSVTAGYFIWLYAIVDKERQQLDLLVQKNVRHQQQITQDYLTSLVEKVMRYSRDNSLSSSVLSSDYQALNDFQNKLMEDIASLKLVRFFSLDQAQTKQTDIPVNFIVVDMINRNERGESVYPELVRDKKENRWFIAIVAPIYKTLSNDMMSQSLLLDEVDIVATEKKHVEDQVKNVEDTVEEQIIGSVYLAVDVEPLRLQLSSLDQTLGQTKLLQRVDDKRFINVLTIGETAGEAGSYPAQKMALVNGNWQLSYTPSLMLYLQAKQTRMPVFIAIVFVTLSLMALFWLIARLINRRPAVVAKSTTVLDTLTKTTNQKTMAITESTYRTNNLLDLELVEEDQLLLDTESSDKKVAATDQDDRHSVPDTIFRAYDIRGIVDQQLTCELSMKIGQAFASDVLDKGDKAIFIGRDGRIHSPKIADAFTRGVLSTGCDVIDLGLVPTPLMNFATSIGKKPRSGAMVTASHNPKNYNGFKFVAKGRTLLDKDIQAIKTSVTSGQFHQGQGKTESLDISQHYIEHILSDIALVNSLHIVIDAANGATSTIAPILFEQLGCKVTPLFCEIDGNFPNHDPDPSVVENLKPLIDRVKLEQADMGLAFDGDGDRLVVVTAEGKIIWPDQLMMLFAEDIVSRNPGCNIIYDVKSTRQLEQIISRCGGRPIMWKTGHANMKAKMRDTGALLAGEFSGHIFFKERWFGFDDGMYAAARLLEIITLGGRGIDSMFEEFQTLITTPEIKIPVAEDKKFTVIEALLETSDFGDAKQTNIDGIRVDFPKGWGLVRASNTSANLTLRFEAETEEAMKNIQRLFKQALHKVDPKLSTYF